MPRFKGASGCYNKHDAREFGLTAAVIWNDIIDRAEHYDEQTIWYDQKKASERLGIPNQTISRSLQTLQEAGRIKVDGGYRPNSSVRTTWITIADEWLDENLIPQNGEPKESQNGEPILNDTKENETELGKSQNEVRMLPATLYSKLRSAFPGSSNDMRKKKVEAVEKLQNEYELSDETILDGVIEIAKHPTYTFKDGTEFTETLSSLLLGDLEKTANKILKKAEASRVKEEKKKKKISRSQALLNSGVC